jgi:hypothetical protein
MVIREIIIAYYGNNKKFYLRQFLSHESAQASGLTFEDDNDKSINTLCGQNSEILLILHHMTPLRFKGFIELVCRKHFDCFGDNGANIVRDISQVVQICVVAVSCIVEYRQQSS